ncbi:MAG: competence/damage-inducible protein A [Bacteroidales bacterium]|jgi:nicotinamide-nucleotide amidase|nr:competence/damage-inducible protein A [Bacteroidales bacterium]
MTAEIITIGDEILIGQIVDTNSAWIAEQLNLNGIEIYQITSVHDSREHITEALKNAESRVDFVIITGGLGPTRDDITKAALCDFFNTKLVFHEPTFQHIKQMFTLRNFDFNKLNQGQAMLPEICEVLPNKMGTAPGMWFAKNGTVFISVPGVPSEMKYLVETEIMHRLRLYAKKEAIFHKTVLTQGLPESTLALKIEDWENMLPKNIKLAYLPDIMSVKLRLSAYGTDEAILRKNVDDEIGKLIQLIPDNIYGFDNDTLAKVIGRLLNDKCKTLSIAESCTGGYVSHQITSVQGCSGYFKGSVIAYSNSIKQSVLGVNTELLEKYGAVSEQAAKEMATGARNVFNTDFALATTGIAGPGGGSEEKPVGMVWIAVADESNVFTAKFQFGNGSREKNIIRSGQTAMQLLRRVILKELQ